MYNPISKPKIEKLPKYLSPSSLMSFTNQPCKSYLQRLLINGMPFDEQNSAAAVGSVFDAYVKDFIIKTYDLDKSVVLKTMRKSLGYSVKHNENLRPLITEENILKVLLDSCTIDYQGQDKQELIAFGRSLCRKYTRIMGVRDVIENIKQVEKHRFFNVNGVNIFCKLDAAIKTDSSRLEPFDWKVSGYNSPMSPKKYYYNSFDDSGLCKGPHKLYEPNVHADVVDPWWATQLCTYGWALGWPVAKEPFYGHIHGLFLRNGKVKIAMYKMLISVEFQSYVMDMYTDLWKALHTGVFCDRLPPEVKRVEFQSHLETWY